LIQPTLLDSKPDELILHFNSDRNLTGEIVQLAATAISDVRE
jgi:hypothetical protein